MSLSKQLSILGFVGVSVVAGFSIQPAYAFEQADLDRLLNTNRCDYCDLSDADLSNADLSDASLFNADLSNADLSDAVLANADLSNANLSNANLSNAVLPGADLSNADLSNADLSNAFSDNANLIGANLIGANLSDASLFNADLSNADLSNTNLIDADLNDANLSDADLSDANLNGAVLPGADLSNADLSNADLSDAYVRENQLSFSRYLDEITLPDGTIPSFCSDEETLSGSSGSFASQSGFGFVQNFSDCDFLIEVAAGNQITLNFDSFDIGDGTLSIFDGMNDTADLLAEFTGDVANSIMSTSNNLFVNFTNKFTPETPGFNVSFSSRAIENPNPATTPESSSILTLLAMGSIGLVTKLNSAKRSS